MTDNAAAWDRHAVARPADRALSTDVAEYGPEIPSEKDLRLLGNVAGKRVLELGCGGAHASIAFAKQGAHAIGVDYSAEQLRLARELLDREEVKVELHQGDLADLAFIRADTVDAAFSSYAFHHVTDLDRVFRQVHRVLKSDASLAFSVPHPAFDMFEVGSEVPLLVRRSYFDRAPLERDRDGITFLEHHRTIGDLFTALGRANFEVDTVLEPEPTADARRGPAGADLTRMVPRTLIVRARKLGN